MALSIALFAVVGAFLPQTAHVERSIVVEASGPTVFTVLNGFRQFNRWSPWADIDPAATTTLAGPETGVGARMSWAGNAEVGTGSQEIIDSVPHERLRVRLAFGDFPGDFVATYALAAEGTGTRVTWSFDADYGSSVFGRYFGLMADAMLGPDYEKGLRRLKQLVESMPKADFGGLPMEVVSTSAMPLLLTTVRSPDEANGIGVALGVAYGRLSGFATAHGLKQAGSPIAIHHGEQDGALRFEAGLPVDRTDIELPDFLHAGRSHEGRALKAVHTGDGAGLAAARQQVRAYLAAAGLEPAGPLWEEYVSDRGNTPPDRLVTNLFVPIK